jgi:hypothetical protein
VLTCYTDPHTWLMVGISQAVVNVMNLQIPYKAGNFLTSQMTATFLSNILLHRIRWLIKGVSSNTLKPLSKTQEELRDCIIGCTQRLNSVLLIGKQLNDVINSCQLYE